MIPVTRTGTLPGMLRRQAQRSLGPAIPLWNRRLPQVARKKMTEMVA